MFSRTPDGKWNISFGDSYSSNNKFNCWNTGIDVFHAFDPRNIPMTVPLKYCLNETKIIYSNYRNNKVNIYQEQRNEASTILKSREEIFLATIFQLFPVNQSKESWKNERIWNKKEQGKKKKFTAKSMKQMKYQLLAVVNKIENPFSLEEAVYLCSEILWDIATVLDIVVVVLWLKEDSNSWIW